MTSCSTLIGHASGDGRQYTRRKIIVVTAKTSYYLNGKSDGARNMYFRGDIQPTMITAVCAYL